MHVCVYISGCYIYTYTAKIWPVIKIAPNLNTSRRNYCVFVFCFMTSQKPPLLSFFFFFPLKEQKVITAGGAFITAAAGWELWICVLTVCQEHVCLTHPGAVPQPLAFRRGTRQLHFRAPKSVGKHIFAWQLVCVLSCLLCVT